jgi:serine/threonine protein kinase
VQLADFGSCRGIYSKQPYTEYISTRWYRAPECLLTDGYYTYKMDMWGVGCVFFEIVSLFPLFPGQRRNRTRLQQRSPAGLAVGVPFDCRLGAKKLKRVQANLVLRQGSKVTV